MKKSASLVVIAMVAASALLSGCQNVKNELGVGRNSPDEFTVVKRAPLSLPPDYTLRAPSTGDVPSASGASSQARAALMGQSRAPVDIAADSPDGSFLKKAGAGAANPEIRSVINKENGIIAVQNKSVGDKLIFWKEGQTDDQAVPASVVNARKEAERLKQNKEEGKPVTDGKVPVIENKQSTIDKLF